MSTFAIPTSSTNLNCACIHLVTSSVAGVEEPPCRSTIVLAGAAQGKLRQDREAPWQSMIRKYAAQPGAHIFKRRRWAAGRDHDRGTDDLAPLRVGAADDERLGHGIEQRKRLLHRARGHLEAAGVDQVVDPPVHDQRAAVIEVADVVGAEPCRAVRVFAEHRRSEGRLATGYLGGPALTAAVFSEDPDGTAWFRTDDVGHLDDRGALVVDGRIDDLIN